MNNTPCEAMASSDGEPGASYIAVPSRESPKSNYSLKVEQSADKRRHSQFQESPKSNQNLKIGQKVDTRRNSQVQDGFTGLHKIKRNGSRGGSVDPPPHTLLGILKSILRNLEK
jgi:hypothetical protein